MKKYLIGFILILSINCTAQDNKYTKLFQIADSIYTDHQNRRTFDSTSLIIWNHKTEKEITVTIQTLLSLYWSGYIDGSCSAIEKKSFDFEMLKANITANKRSIESYQRFLQLQNKKL